MAVSPFPMNRKAPGRAAKVRSALDGVFDREEIRRAGRPVFFNNNGIHPGEPEGIDACMAIVRDFCFDPAKLATLGDTVLLFVPVYNRLAER